MKRIFLRHGAYTNAMEHRLLDVAGLIQAKLAGEKLAEFAAAPTTTILVSDRDRTIETAYFLVMPEAEARAAVDKLRERAFGTQGQARYIALSGPLHPRFTLMPNLENQLPAEWARFQGDLIVVGHSPAAEKLGLDLRAGEFKEF